MNNTLRIETVNDASGCVVKAAYFTIGNKTLSDIDREFRGGRSNERFSTFYRGTKAYRKDSVLSLLIGKKYIVDTSGESLNCGVTGFSQDTVMATHQVTYQDDGFYSDQDRAELNKQEALKYKEVLKCILGFSRVVHTNPNDQRLRVIQVTGEESETVVQSIFSDLVENTNLSFAEISL